MAFVVTFVKTIRNNWKKSVFFTGLSIYGINYVRTIYDDSLIRQAYCEEAKKYGDVPLRTGERARKVTVFLNPAARKGKAKKLFDKNVAPILHLAGLDVTVVRTEYEGQAKKYMDVLDPTDAILVAGGDGTLAEVVTGLLRRQDADVFGKTPIGVIPLGFTNTLANSLFSKEKSEAKWMLDSAFAVVKGDVKPVDIMGITDVNDRTVYAVSSLEWGSFREGQDRAKKYWYFGPLKKHWSYLMSTFGQWPPLVQAKLSFVHPCDGCSHCYVAPVKPQWKWWHIFLPPKVQVPEKDYSMVENSECGQEHEEQISTLQLVASTHNIHPRDSIPKENRGFQISLGPQTMNKMEFIKAGLNKNKDPTDERSEKKIEVQKISLEPTTGHQSHGFYVIDNEQYETIPVTMTFLRDHINVFSS